MQHGRKRQRRLIDLFAATKPSALAGQAPLGEGLALAAARPTQQMRAGRFGALARIRRIAEGPVQRGMEYAPHAPRRSSRFADGTPDQFWTAAAPPAGR